MSLKLELTHYSGFSEIHEILLLNPHAYMYNQASESEFEVTILENRII